MPTYQQATGKSIQESFEEYDKRRPEVYELFKKYVREIVQAKGRNIKTSSKLIINRIRWEQYLRTNSEDEYCINDAFSAHYSRKFVADYPEWAHLFNFREIRAV